MEKKLPGFKVGHDWRIDEADLAALIENAKANTKQIIKPAGEKLITWKQIICQAKGIIKLERTA